VNATDLAQASCHDRRPGRPNLGAAQPTGKTKTRMRQKQVGATRKKTM